MYKCTGKALVFLLVNLFLVSAVTNAQLSTAPTAEDDDRQLRDLTTKFFKSWEKLDAETHLSIWSKTSEEGAENWKSIPQMWARYDKVELKKLEFHKVSVAHDKAIVRITVNLAAIDKKTGKPIGGFMNRDADLSFIYLKDSGRWLLDSWIGTSSEIAGEFVALKTDKERSEYLATEKPRFDREAISETSVAAYDIGMRDNEYDRSLAILKFLMLKAEAIDDKEMIGQVANMMGDIYDRLGDHGSALDSSLVYLQASQQEASDSVANAYNSVGASYAILEDHERAIDSYRKSLAVKTVRPRTPTGTARVLGNIGNSQIGLGDLEAAQKTYEKLLQIANENKIEPELIRANEGLARVYRAKNDFARAIEYDQAALERAESTKDRNVVTYVNKSTAETFRLAGQYDKSIKLAQFAWLTASEMGVPDLGWDAKVTEGKSLASLGRIEEATEAFNLAIATIEAMRERSLGGVDSQQRFFENKQSPYRALLELRAAEGKNNEALALAEESKSRVLLGLLAGGRGEILTSMSIDEREEERRLGVNLANLNRRLQAERMRPNADSAKIAPAEKAVSDARTELEAFRAKLYARYPTLKALRGETKVITGSEDTADLLERDGTALLEYAVNDDQLYIFLITKAPGRPAKLTVKKVDLSAIELSKLTTSFQSSIASGDLNFQRIARDLYSRLIKPVAAELKGKDKIVIVPDGPLWNLSFGALTDEKGRPLLDGAAVSYAPSFSALREMKQRNKARSPSNTLELLAFGNPTVAAQTEKRVGQVFMDEKLEPLPEAERLVNRLAKMYGPERSKVYTGAAASEETAKSEAPKYRIVQFATHGILNDVSPMYSHLVLAQNGNNPDEDGLLEAWELKDLDLKADMVILSACDTARGRISNGEGIIGMTWAAFIAGAPTTVASQWKVESTSTTELMLEFHRQLLTGKVSKAEALRRAQLKLMRNPKFKHPSYWAAWVIVGDAS